MRTAVESNGPTSAVLWTFLAARHPGDPPETQVFVTASDDGAGISSANRARVFEPFFTTRRDSGGTGLGLGIVVALLKAHHGTIELVEADIGTTFRIQLPSAFSSARSEP
ncbi:ATP-binding protein [Aureimonas psammosilenae]|uniref:ATP-binding protein n=1 Tax=Aureimonas psammosilenae TaxID=2495496 RepID=UPI0038B3C9FA